MVVALGPGKFYGSSLPRPRIYTDVKLNDDRVDPPLPVNDAFLAWATEAHWSMGGLSFKRHRLQGRIEGNIIKLRSEREKFFKKSIKTHTDKVVEESGKDSAPRGATKRYSSPSPPPAPLASKKRRFMKLLDEEDDNEGERETEVQIRRRPARKLWDDFDRVASDKKSVTPVKSVTPPRTRGRRSEKEGDETMEVAVEVNKSNSVGKRLMKVKPKRSNEKENDVSSDSSAGKTPTVKRASPRLVKRRLS